LNEEQNQKIPDTSESSLLKFCALEYREQEVSRVAPVILFVFEDEKGSLHFLVHPDWRSVVQPEDSKYIESLLNDFLERAKEQPAPLFKQLSSLGVGPLVTQQAGERISDYPQLLELCSQFTQL
jgi:predicted NAD/FAD-binding protein